VTLDPSPIGVDEGSESLFEGRAVGELGEVFHRGDDVRLLVRVDLANLAPGNPRRADQRDLAATRDLDGHAVANGPLSVVAELEVRCVVVWVLRSLTEPVGARNEARLEHQLHLHLEEELLVLAAPLARRPLVHDEEGQRSCAFG
jgi:hypothetical protein